MDQSTSPPAPSATQNTNPRETMFCHECHDEWYRDEHGITCPQCQSEFTEIIEDDNDPRETGFIDHDHDTDDDSMQSLEDAAANLHRHHPRNHADDPDEADISTMRWQNVGPGRYHVSATIHRTISPAQLGPSGNGPNTLGGFSSILANLLQNAARPPGQQNDQAGEDQDGAGSRSDGGPHVHRFTYNAGARLHPRDANNPEPRLEPVDDINNVLAALLAALGEPPGGHAGGPGHPVHPNHPIYSGNPGHPGYTGHTGHIPPNPFMSLIASVTGGRHGDAVYSQEALDRIISQFMDQTAGGNAPGPASAEDISSLPRKNVTVDMLGPEGRAECSICMDEVNIGEEVSELPCKHWFHHQCVAAWLTEHDTCPHCRKGISNSGERSGNTASTANTTSSATPTTTPMLSALGLVRHRSADNPFIASGNVPPQDASGSNADANIAQAQDGADQGASSSNGGIRGRLRRGLFGPR